MESFSWAEKVAGKPLPKIQPISEQEFNQRFNIQQELPKPAKKEQKPEKKTEQKAKPQPEKKRCINKECNEIFSLTDGEKNFFTRNHLEMPKRCPKCRSVRKQQV